MIGAKFIFRVLQALLYLGLASAFVTLLIVGGGYAFRWMWNMFELHFQQQAEWFRSKTPILKPWKTCAFIFVTVFITLVCVAVVAFIYLSGQSARGNPIP